jgi:hypothetical protein
MRFSGWVAEMFVGAYKVSNPIARIKSKGLFV